MQIEAVRSFLTLYDTGNMTRASEKLYITQQCLSQQIKSVERELGVTLFIRRRTGMVPTDICRQLYQDFKKIYVSYTNINRLCEAQKFDSKSRVVIAVANGLTNYLDMSSLTTLFQELFGGDLVMEEHPSNKCVQLLGSGEADMAFLLEPFDDTFMEHVFIQQDYGCVVLHKNNPLAAVEGPLPFSALNGYRAVTGVRDNCAVENFERYCARSNIYPKFVAFVSNVTGYVNQLKDEDIAVIFLNCLLPQITNPDVVIKRIKDPLLIGRCHCCIAQDSPRYDYHKELMLAIKDYYNNKY